MLRQDVSLQHAAAPSKFTLLMQTLLTLRKKSGKIFAPVQVINRKKNRSEIKQQWSQPTNHAMHLTQG